jgi:hypothetical protein
MRFYGFGNYYLSSLQQGLQAAHAAVDLHVKYNILEQGHYDIKPCQDMYNDWAQNHKTMVLLNGGNSADLQDLFDFLYCEENPYPFVKFHEDEVSLNGALTYVGMILPEKIYSVAALMRSSWHVYNSEEKMLRVPDRNDTEYTTIFLDFSQFEYDLAQRLNLYGLAK